MDDGKLLKRVTTLESDGTPVEFTYGVSMKDGRIEVDLSKPGLSNAVESVTSETTSKNNSLAQVVASAVVTRDNLRRRWAGCAVSGKVSGNLEEALTAYIDNYKGCPG